MIPESPGHHPQYLVTLAAYMDRSLPKIVCTGRLIAFPYFWQIPAATEKAAYDSMSAMGVDLDFDYVGFPWATLIDGLRGDADSTAALLTALESLRLVGRSIRRRVTVAQHIHSAQFLELFRACGITDLFWSHATISLPDPPGMRIHPFPLFPAQTPPGNKTQTSSTRRYLANFIGAYSPGLYLTNVRQVIFDDPNEYNDLLIVRRDAWHFDRVVYDEQIKGVRAQEHQILKEQKFAQQYLDAIGDSWFTLCPSGSGPNSIRIFESMRLGSIPIILSRDLRLPGSKDDWEQASIIEEDSADGYHRAIVRARSMTASQRLAMCLAGEALATKVAPEAYGRLIADAIVDP